MTNLDKFSEVAKTGLQCYVYHLIDPRNGKTFYVGRGQYDRVFQHAKGEILDNNEDDRPSPKLERIRDIKNANLPVIHIIHRHGMNEETAKVVEAALIDAYPGLTNIQGGEGSASFGPMHVEEIESLYNKEVLDDNIIDKLLLINVNGIENTSTKEAIYQRVRGNWRLNKDRANKADFIIAVRRGVTIGVFKLGQDKKWYESSESGRYCFDGVVASDADWKRFVGSYGKRVPNSMKNGQNPIRYVNIP